METLKPYITAMIPLYCVDLDQLFPQKIQADRARAMLQLMFVQYHIYMVNNPKYAPYLDRKERYCFLEANKLQLIGKGTYKQVLSTLISNNIIQVNAHPTTGTEHYRPGRAKEYRIHPWLTHQAKIAGGRTYRRERIETPVVINVVKKMFDNQYPNKLKSISSMKPMFGKIMTFTDSLVLDIEAIEQDLNSGKLPDPKETLYSIAETYAGGYNRHVKFDKLTKRLYHHLCNLPSELRNYLVHPDGEPLVELDFVNSHPWVLSSCLLNPEIFIEFAPEFKPVYERVLQRYSNCNDVKRLHHVCCMGEFIPNWLYVTGVIKKLGDPYTKGQKQAAKELVFHHIMYGDSANHFKKGTPEHEERFKTELLFKTEYPNVHQALVELKRTPEKILPFIKHIPRANGKKGLMRSTPSVILQVMEAYLVYQVIIPLFQSEGIVSTTIHDSFILSINDKDRALKIMQNAFMELGIKPPKLRVTGLGETNI